LDPTGLSGIHAKEVEMAQAADAAPGGGAGRHWWALVLIGVLSIVAGVIAVVYPGITLLFLGLIFGANLLVWGTLNLVIAFDAELGVARIVLRVIIGVLAAMAGLVCLVRPGVGATALLFAVSFWFVLAGMADVVQAISVPEHRGLTFLIGLVTIVAGVIILADPGIGLQTLALLAGIGFIARGILEVAAGFVLRRA
jgi:uncharacterized membrane protein HdeD (DUF308 family)